MKSFLVGLGGDKGGRLVDLFMNYGKSVHEKQDQAKIVIQGVNAQDESPLDMNIRVGDSEKETQEGTATYTVSSGPEGELAPGKYKVTASSKGFMPASGEVDIEEGTSYRGRVGLVPTSKKLSVLTLLFMVLAPIIWVGLRYVGVIPPAAQDISYLGVAAMVNVMELIGATLGAIVIGRFIVNAADIEDKEVLGSTGGMVLGGFFGVMLLLLLRDNISTVSAITPQDIMYILILILILATLGITLDYVLPKAYGLSAIKRKGKSMFTPSIGAGLGALFGGEVSYLVVNNFIKNIAEIEIAEYTLLFLPLVVTAGSILWSYFITEALKKETEQKSILGGVISLMGAMIFSSAIVLYLGVPDLFLPFVGLSTLGALLGFISTSKFISFEEVGPIFSFEEVDSPKRSRKKYRFLVNGVVVETMKSKLDKLQNVPQENYIYVGEEDQGLTPEQRFTLEKEKLKAKVKSIFSKTLEECFEYFANFIVFIDLRNSELCGKAEGIIDMLKEEYSLPVYAVVVTCPRKVNYKWLRGVAGKADAVFPVDYNLFEDNEFLDNMLFEEEGELKEEEVWEEGCVAQTVRRLSPILEVGTRDSPAGVDISHVKRTLKKDTGYIGANCESMEAEDELPPTAENWATIGYARVKLDKCEEINFETDLGNYLIHALGDKLWDFDVDRGEGGELSSVRALLLLRGKGDYLKTHIAKAWFNRVFNGLTVTVSDLIANDSEYLEIIVLLSHLPEEFPTESRGGCSEGEAVTPPTGPTSPPVGPEPQEKTPDPHTTVEPTEVKKPPQEVEPGDRWKTGYQAYANVAAKHYYQPLVRQLAVKLASSHPGDRQWEQVKDIYEWVRDKVSYVRDPVDQEYIQYPEETIENKGGDCDDQAVLLAALLMNVGFDAELVFIPNHVYVAVNLPNVPANYKTYGSQTKSDGTNWNDWVGMDPTCTNCGFGRLPESDFRIEGVKKIGRGG